jgi:excisionase family DNA binding protein
MITMTNDSDLQQWYSVIEAAEFLGVSKARIHQFIKEERLPVWKPTKTTFLISGEALTKFREIPREVGNPDWKK